MIKAINDQLVPLGVRLPQTDREIVGGYFIWLTLPDGMEGGALVERAREDENVVVAQVRTIRAMVVEPADSNANTGRALRGKFRTHCRGMEAYRPRFPVTMITHEPRSRMTSESASQ
jgi:hypothetical protein